MAKVSKVGIHKDTEREDHVTMTMRTWEGTYRFDLDVNLFIEGWFRPGSKDTVGPFGGRREVSPHMKAEGALAAIAEANGGTLPDEVEQAILGFGITPSFLRDYGHTDAKRIKWARKKAGGWGGRRQGAGRKPR